MGIKATIVVLGGDGIGPEVTHEGVSVLQAIASRASVMNSNSKST